jgi:hypothetical protein
MAKSYTTPKTSQSKETTPTKDGKFKVNAVKSVPERFWGEIIPLSEFQWEWKKGDPDEA